MNLDPSIWQELASIDAGDFSEIPYAVLLSALARQRRSVEVEMIRKPIEKRIVVAQGAPVDCRSNLAHETFGRYLVSVETISDEEFRSSLAESLSRGVPLGEILLEHQLLTPQALYRSLRQNLARKLLDGFTWKSGSFRLLEVEAPAEAEVRVNPAQLILTGTQKLSPPEEVARATESLRGLALARARGPSPVGRFRPRGAAETLLAELDSGARTLTELGAAIDLPQVEVDRAVYGLGLLGQVVPAEGLAADPEPPGEVAPGAVVEVSSESVAKSEPEHSPPPADEVLLLQSKVLEAYLCFRRRDAFDILGLPEDADLEQIEAAYLEAARTFAPWGPLYEALGDDREKAQILFLAVADAYAELKSSESRGAVLYRRKVAREKRESQKVAKTDFAIETNLLDPEVQYEKAQQMIAAGNLKKAVETLDFAADCDPQNPLYRAEAAFARHRLDPRLHRKRVVEDLVELLRTHPRNGLATYYLGMIHADHESFDEAETYLRRSIKLLAPDRRPIDALKELSARRR